MTALTAVTTKIQGLEDEQEEIRMQQRDQDTFAREQSRAFNQQVGAIGQQVGAIYLQIGDLTQIVAHSATR